MTYYEKKSITKEEVEEHFNGRYDVTTIVPVCENPYICKYAVDHDELRQLMEDLLECGEFICDIKFIKE